MVERLNICFLILVLPFFAVGQIDSLRSEIISTSDPELLTRLHNAIAWDYRDVRADSALFHANKAYKLAQEHGFDHLSVQALNYMGVAYRNLSIYSKAFEKYLEALSMAERIGDEEQRGYALINVGNLYLFQTNYDGAIRYFIQALDQAQSLGNKRMQGYCFVNLGRSYRGISEFGQSELYYKQALEVRSKLNDHYGIKAVEVDLADMYRRKGDLEKALSYSYRVASEMKPETDGRSLLMLYNNIAKIYLLQGKTKLAEDNAINALAISKQFASRFDEKEILVTLSRIYETKNDFEEAFKMHTEYAELNQQLFSEENIRKIEQLRNQYEIQQQEAENEFLKRQDDLNKEIIGRQRTIIALTIAAIFLFIILAAISYRAYVIRTRLSKKITLQRDKIEKDKELIEKQTNKLQELDEAKSRFFANVSHDLRSPLSLILGNLEMIQEDKDSFLTPQAKQCLEVGFKNSKRLLYLTDEINDITKLEEGKISLKFEKVRVNSYLKLLSEMFRSTAEYKGVKLLFNSTFGELDTFTIDPRQFEKIFYNLVSNAVRHTHKGDQITISSQRKGKDFFLSISDSGEGIDPESLPYIFDRFYQSKNNQFKSREGLGIGLALVKELVELHYGEISVESRVGKGTMFKILFTKQDLIEAVESPEQSGSFTKEQNSLFRDLEVDIKSNTNVVFSSEDKGSTVLIVDDHPEIRYYLRQVLEDQHSILEAAHGLEAMELLKNREVDLIITDLMMPWMDGFELIEAINQSEELRAIPLLVVSARISENSKEEVLYHGVNEYLQKPFQKKELLLRIDNLLKQKSKYESQTDNVFKNLTLQENINSVEKDIISKLESIVKEKIADPRLSVLQLADAMAASERQVYRLVKKLTGMTPHEYIMEVRLQYVEYLIKNNKVKNATEAARKVGQNNVTTFNRQFQRKFGVKPAELISN